MKSPVWRRRGPYKLANVRVVLYVAGCNRYSVAYVAGFSMDCRLQPHRMRVRNLSDGAPEHCVATVQIVNIRQYLFDAVPPEIELRQGSEAAHVFCHSAGQ